MRLGNFLDAGLVADFDPDIGQLEEADLHTLPVSPSRGRYSRLGDSLVILYVDMRSGDLRVRIDDTVFDFDDDLAIDWRLRDAAQTDLMWHVRTDGEAELTVSDHSRTVRVRYASGPSDTVPLALDTSAMVEYEDFDFGLYLMNLMQKGTFRDFARSAMS